MNNNNNNNTHHTTGYVAMGSFHSENVDDLMALHDDEYVPPVLPFDTFVENNSDDYVGGDAFLLDRKKWTFLNHGAFGAGLRVGHRRAEQWRDHLERQPLRYFDRDLLPHLVFSARRLASFCHVPSDHRDGFTLIPNVTYGLNAVLHGYVNDLRFDSSRSVSQQPIGALNNSKPHVILWDTSYGSLKKMANEYCQLRGGRVTEIPVSRYFDRWGTSSSKSPLPPSNGGTDIFMEALQDTISLLDDGTTTEHSLFILDHTTSNTALNMPLESLAKFGHDQGWIVLVDGAHGILAQNLDLSIYTHGRDNNIMQHVDIYVGNCHKWLSTPRGVGFLYCPKLNIRESILRHPAVMSHGIGEGFQARFLWDGCRDYGAALSIPAVLDFWERQATPADTRRRIEVGRNEAVAVLGEAWHGTEDNVTLAPLDVHSPMMALVRLPECVQPKDRDTATSTEAKKIQDFLYDHFIEVPIKVVGGMYYVRYAKKSCLNLWNLILRSTSLLNYINNFCFLRYRISYHVYNTNQEYARLARTMMQYSAS
jgi:isopenicillin-N epimerase